MTSKIERDPVDRWLSSCGENTRHVYSSYFKAFEQYVGKSGSKILAEHQRLFRNPETADTYPQILFDFYKYLLSGDVKAKRMGSIGGRAGGWTGRFKDKPLAQTTARTAITAVQSFFSFHNSPINLRKFIKKDVRMRNPKVERKKHQLLSSEIDALLRVANLRDKAVLCLGLMGQDESTIASLKVEAFQNRLEGKRLEFIELLRPKTNEDILLLLTPEVQKIISTYVRSLERSSGWLFEGYKHGHIQPSLCNDIFKDVCKRAGVKGQNSRRLSFHCCRMWFSMQLRNKISDDLIDLLTGHAQRFGGAYIGDTEKIRESLVEASVSDALKLQGELTPLDEVRRKSLLDFAKIQGFSEEKLRRLEDVLARSKDVDEAVKEFRRFQETKEGERMRDGNGKYHIACGDSELMHRLHDGWKLVQSLNHDRYLLEHL